MIERLIMPSNSFVSRIIMGCRMRLQNPVAVGEYAVVERRLQKQIVLDELNALTVEIYIAFAFASKKRSHETDGFDRDVRLGGRIESVPVQFCGPSPAYWSPSRSVSWSLMRRLTPLR